jgi:hypothetical protein
VSVFADWFDGRQARVRRVELRIDAVAGAGTVLVLDPPEADEVLWPLAELRALRDQADGTVLVLGLTSDPVARLVVADPEMQATLRRRAPGLHRRPPAAGTGRLLGWAAAAVASVAAIVFLLVPLMADQLAAYLPPAGEKALGNATLEQIRAAMGTELLPVGFCTGSAGRTALDRLASAMNESVEAGYEIEVHVLDNDMVNAFALPGGHIVFFRGLIEAAESPEEVAAVYAHELGHVVNRDPTRSALRTAGSVGVLGLLLGDFAGGTAVLFLTERLIEAAYSQAAEAGADAFAHRRMAAAGLPPSALATLFERLRQEHGDDESLLAHFLAHPTLGDRIAAAREAAAPAVLRPLLAPADWAALQRICD